MPPGYKTAGEWAREWNKTPSYAYRLLTNGIVCRLIVRRSFRIRSADGGARPVPHYAERK